MDAQQIKSFIDAMASSDLAEMTFSQDGWTLRLVRRTTAGAQAAAPALAAMASAASAAPVAARAAQASPVPDVAAATSELLAPLYGVIHLQTAPGEPPLVAAGMPVRAGQTLCVIEAMKVFNEVRAEHDAIVDAVLVASGQEVEAGQALLRFR